jgi:hypothetical protein
MDVRLRICIGIPTNRGIKAKTVKSLMSIVNTFKYDYEFVIATEGFTVAQNRIYIVEKAKEAQCTHVLFIDDDMVFPADTLDRLLAHNKEVVGVDSHSRTLPLKSTVLFDGTLMPKELFECIQVGTGIMLIDMKIFTRMVKPYFEFQMMDSGFMKMGEDAWFCEEVYRLGFKVYCDPTIEVKHIGDYEY